MEYLKYIAKGLNPVNFYYISSKSIRDFFGIHYNSYKNKIHIKAAMEWLSKAQKVNKDGGVGALYSLFDGWNASYIETTGYIISTFFNYAEYSKDKSYREKAVEMANFELKNQLPNGGFEGGRGKGKPVTFNTGQVIFGLCRAYKETKQQKYKKAAEKASDLLLSAMDKNGCFVKHLYLNHIHTYNTRTAWSLLRVHEITKKGKYKKAAQKNMDWALTQQLDNGYFLNNAFYPKQEPLLHTIAYSIRGVLEAALYLNNRKYLESAIKAATQLLKAQRKDGSLPGSFNKNWKSSVSWSCLTGNSQMSIIWQKLYLKTKDRIYIAAAKKSNAYMKKTQNLKSKNLGIRGGIAGAYPIYGWYAPFSYVNWGAKFFVDALMLEENQNIIENIDS